MCDACTSVSPAAGPIVVWRSIVKCRLTVLQVYLLFDCVQVQYGRISAAPSHLLHPLKSLAHLTLLQAASFILASALNGHRPSPSCMLHATLLPPAASLLPRWLSSVLLYAPFPAAQ